MPPAPSAYRTARSADLRSRTPHALERSSRCAIDVDIQLIEGRTTLAKGLTHDLCRML